MKTFDKILAIVIFILLSVAFWFPLLILIDAFTETGSFKILFGILVPVIVLAFAVRYKDSAKSLGYYVDGTLAMFAIIGLVASTASAAGCIALWCILVAAVADIIRTALN